jgi:hypothetical protein
MRVATAVVLQSVSIRPGRGNMGLNVYLLLLVPVLSDPADVPLPELVRLKQDAPRSVAKLTLPRSHVVGPTIPGLKQGAVPQGLAFMDGHVILSVSYRRNDDSTLAVYSDPMRGEKVKPHTFVKVQGGQSVPLWFLDGKNRVKEIKYPPMSEGITPYGKQLGVICESGAAKYKKRGRGGLDSIIFLTPLAQD